MATSFYDVVVAGDELAGTIAAAHLARRGIRVLVLASPPVEKESLGPFPIPRAPLTLTGLDSPALKRISGELNLLQLLRRRTEAHRPAYQVLLPDHRIDVSANDLPREMARELPEDAAAFERWTNDASDVSARLEEVLAQDVTLPADGFWDRRDIKRIAAQLPSPSDIPRNGGSDAQHLELPAGHAARMVARLPVVFASDLADPGITAQARLFDLFRRGTFRLDGGRETLKTLLFERIRAYAGEVRHDVSVRGLILRRGRITGVAIGNRDEQVGCSLAICAMPAADVVDLLADAPPRRLAQAASIPAAYRRYRLHLVTPLEALPDALGGLAYSVRDLDQPLSGANAILVQVTPGHGQHAVLTVEARCADPSPDHLRLLREGIRSHLEGFIPFLDRHLLAAWSPHDGLPPEGHAVTASTSPPESTSMDGIWAMPSPRPLGFSGLPHASGLRGVFLASRQVLPGLGFEGELITGWVAARLVAAKLNRREVNKGELLSS